MSIKICIAGLPYFLQDQQLMDLCMPHASVLSAHVVTDGTTGRSRGLGFVKLHSVEDAHKAIAALNGADLEGHILRCGLQ
jgi:cold-inducible RNA-binding protein